jgi:hypothetical protein
MLIMEPMEDRKDAYNGGVEAQEKATWWVWIPVVADSHTLMRRRIQILVSIKGKKSDPDPHCSEKMDPDPHLSDAEPQP